MFNLPAVFIVLAITSLLIRGVRESARANSIMVGIKLAVLAFFIVVARHRVQHRQLQAVRPHGDGGDRRRGGGHLLRLHRLRRGLDRQRGGPEPETRPADRDHRLAGDLHAGLHPGRGRRDRLARRRGAGGVRRAAGRRRWRRAPASSGPASVIAVGALVAITSVVLTDPLRPDPDLLRDVPRRPDAAPRSPRSTRAPARRSRLTLILGMPDRGPRRARAADGDRQARQHRHAVRVRPGQHRRDHPAPHAARHGAAVPRAVRRRCSRSSASCLFLYLMTHLPGETWVRFVVLAGRRLARSTTSTAASTRACAPGRPREPRPPARR